ncbi:hypothetical protein HMI54_007293 [Coelomomyces lativittatus]|nr:hypothetical protein HMI54_007293 [Coelomomyces lativittatus]
MSPFSLWNSNLLPSSLTSLFMGYDLLTEPLLCLSLPTTSSGLSNLSTTPSLSTPCIPASSNSSFFNSSSSTPIPSSSSIIYLNSAARELLSLILPFTLLTSSVPILFGTFIQASLSSNIPLLPSLEGEGREAVSRCILPFMKWVPTSSRSSSSNASCMSSTFSCSSTHHLGFTKRQEGEVGKEMEKSTLVTSSWPSTSSIFHLEWTSRWIPSSMYHPHSESKENVYLLVSLREAPAPGPAPTLTPSFSTSSLLPCVPPSFSPPSLPKSPSSFASTPRRLVSEPLGALPLPSSSTPSPFYTVLSPTPSCPMLSSPTSSIRFPSSPSASSASSSMSMSMSMASMPFPSYLHSTFSVGRLLGRGSFGAVYEFPFPSSHSMDSVLHEVKTFASVSSHPNILRYYNAWIEYNPLEGGLPMQHSGLPSHLRRYSIPSSSVASCTSSSFPFRTRSISSTSSCQPLDPTHHGDRLAKLPKQQSDEDDTDYEDDEDEEEGGEGDVEEDDDQEEEEDEEEEEEDEEDDMVEGGESHPFGTSFNSNLSSTIPSSVLLKTPTPSFRTLNMVKSSNVSLLSKRKDMDSTLSTSFLPSFYVSPTSTPSSHEDDIMNEDPTFNHLWPSFSNTSSSSSSSSLPSSNSTFTPSSLSHIKNITSTSLGVPSSPATTPLLSSMHPTSLVGMSTPTPTTSHQEPTLLEAGYPSPPLSIVSSRSSTVRHRRQGSEASCLVPFLMIQMECPELTLKAFLKKQKKPLSPTVAVSIWRDVALGLSHIHDCGYVHCDLSASNIFLNSQSSMMVPPLHHHPSEGFETPHSTSPFPQYQVLVGDFGLSVPIRRPTSSSSSSSSPPFLSSSTSSSSSSSSLYHPPLPSSKGGLFTKGTPIYMPPESTSLSPSPSSSSLSLSLSLSSSSPSSSTMKTTPVDFPPAWNVRRC